MAWPAVRGKWAGRSSPIQWRSLLNHLRKDRPMKRDMDLIRRIVLATAELPYGEQIGKLDGVNEEDFIVHVIWLKEAGLLCAITPPGDGMNAKFAIISRLTWNGCEFADAIQSDTLWKKAKESVMRPGISYTFDVLKDWLKTEISQGLPTLRALSNQVA